MREGAWHVKVAGMPETSADQGNSQETLSKAPWASQHLIPWCPLVRPGSAQNYMADALQDSSGWYQMRLVGTGPGASVLPSADSKASPAQLAWLHNPLHTQQSQIPPHSGEKQVSQVELVRQFVGFEILCGKCRHSGLQHRDRHGRTAAAGRWQTSRCKGP